MNCLPMPPKHSERQPLDRGDDTDEELYRSLKDGDQVALRVLYDRYARLIYTIAFNVLHNGPEAEDLTQEVFLELWHKTTYNPTRSSLSRFLSVVTRNRAIDRVRTKSNRRRILKEMTPQLPSLEAFSLPEKWAAQGERSQRVRQALQDLPEKQRNLLWLAFYHGLSQSEIAAHTNIPLGTVKSRIRQGLMKLKGTLQDLSG